MFAKSSVPYMIPNWHSVSATDSDSFQFITNRFNRMLVIDNQSSGVYDGKCLRKSCDSVYNGVSHTTLPFFVNKRNKLLNLRKRSKNSLIYCSYEQLLLSSYGNRITAYDLSSISSKEQTEHYFSTTCDAYVSHKFPFAHRLTNINDVYVNHDSSPIFQLKKNNYSANDCTDITALSKQNIKLFKLRTDETNTDERTFEPIHVIDTIEHNDSLDNDFKFCDRNPYFSDKILISGNNDIFEYFDINSNKSIWPKHNRKKFKYDISKQIGLDWCRNHSQSFFYGEIGKIMLVDVRGIQLPLTVCDKQKSKSHFYEWERFYALCPSLTNDYQIFLVTDYSIICIDYRYPQQNLIQYNHMLSSEHFSLFTNLINISLEEESKKEIVVSSNLFNSCLMTFERNLPIQPTSLHFPAHISSPSDIKPRFSSSYLKGVQMIPFRKENVCCFSVASLTGDGHIFMQDFYPNENSDQSSSAQSETPNLVIDENSIDYLKCINEYFKKQNLDLK